MIVSFGNRTAEDIYHGLSTRHTRVLPIQLWERARDKLDMLEAAHQLSDLKFPPGNRLEELRGNRKGFLSLRINDQWRITFRWDDGPALVRIEDYQ